VPGYPLRNGGLKRAEFFAERIVHNVQQTAQKLRGAAHILLQKTSEKSFYSAGVGSVTSTKNVGGKNA
jgi:hypothetical protein